MEIRILGPLEVRDGDRVLELGGGKQKALLADLVIHRPEPLSADRLIDDLWGEQPPPSASKTLQALVSRLRKALGRDVVRSSKAGYVLGDDGVTTDVDELERLLQRRRTNGPGAEDALLAALALFRGRPLADFTYDEFAQSEIARLEELRLTVLEDRIDADLAAGRHKEAAAELERLTVEHPLRERFREQWMLALYRAGRQAEALDVYQATRTTLLEQLGIEPGPSIRELHQRILRQDDQLGVPERDAPSPAVPRGTFVGRKDELAELARGLEDALAGRGRLFLISGEPGAGKSRLTEELAAVATARGACVLVGRSWEAGGAPAYWPWVESLGTYVRELDEAALAAQLGPGAVELAQILPGLRELVRGIPEAPVVESESARFRLFTATRDFLASASRARPIVLVLDDLHAADASSLLLLRFLARSLASMRLLAIAAFRDVDPTPNEPLVDLLAEVTREPATRRISLSGLSPTEVAEYVQVAAAELATEELAVSLHRRTEGNALFVSETVRLLAVEGAAPDETAIPPSVRDVILRRLRHLSDDCNRLLALASVLGRDFNVQTLATASGVGIDDVLESLEGAMTERVVTEVRGNPQQLRFGHILMRDALYESVSPGRRVRLHRLAAETLETMYGSDPGPQLAELVNHAVAGCDFERAVEYASRAGDRALSQLAYEEAARLYRTALDALKLTRPGDLSTRCELLLVLGEAEARAGDDDAAKEAFSAAAELADTLALPSHFARAAVGYGGRIAWARAADDSKLVPLLEAALARLPEADVALRARLLARLAGALRDEPVYERRQALSAEALELARRSGDLPAIAIALDTRVVSMTPASPAELLAISDELLEVAARIGNREHATHAHLDRAYAYIQFGDARVAREALAAARLLADELRQPTQQWLIEAAMACLALAEGRFGDAKELAESAHEIGVTAQPADAAAVYVLHRYFLADLLGRVTEVQEMLEAVATAYPARPIFRCALAHGHLARGEADKARAIFDDFAQDDFAGVTFDPDWPLAMSVLVELAVALRDERALQPLRELLRPYGGRMVSNIPEGIRGAAARYIGLAAAFAGDWREAREMFEAALELNATTEFRPWLARTQADYGRCLLARDAGDAAAPELLRQAIATFHELGMEQAAEQLQRA